jgi:uncharacterized repeat protein (TIGR03803 family)
MFYQGRSTQTQAVVLFLISTLAFAIFATPHALAQTESVLYNFTTAAVGDTPYSDLIMDSAGNLYGMTCSGGPHGLGTVFELTPVSGAGWTVKMLHAFGASSSDGAEPLSGLTMDASGNVYGATAYGGTENFGTIFQLRPNANGDWGEMILHNFTNNGKDGLYPGSNLTLDSAGNLYGTTWQGGTQNGGTVFELTPHSGNWAEKVIYSLPNPRKSSNFSSEPVTLDSAGNLYGTTIIGGPSNGGFVFKLTPTGTGHWTTKKLYAFGKTGSGPYTPLSGVIFDSAGNLYGTTAQGGISNTGTVYELSPSLDGTYTEQTIWEFPYNCPTGCDPVSGLIIDSAGNLYGTGQSGGTYNSGTVFELSPSAGAWTETVLHNFLGDSGDGLFPKAGLLRDSSGNLYGTTIDGGSHSVGVVFEVIP